ncbi:MAG: hypothetical protein P8Y67_01790 [Alphaproteobacteria bacterium]
MTGVFYLTYHSLLVEEIVIAYVQDGNANMTELLAAAQDAVANGAYSETPLGLS